jgi:hypothetical protein
LYGFQHSLIFCIPLFFPWFLHFLKFALFLHLLKISTVCLNNLLSFADTINLQNYNSPSPKIHKTQNSPELNSSNLLNPSSTPVFLQSSICTALPVRQIRLVIGSIAVELNFHNFHASCIVDYLCPRRQHWNAVILISFCSRLPLSFGDFQRFWPSSLIPCFQQKEV